MGDVAKVLGVSHGSVYRHFPSKQALRDAVARRWLDRLAAIKQDMVLNDPELFATFSQPTTEAREVVAAHEHLAAQVTEIVADGVAGGEFVAADPAKTGWALLHAAARFHHPLHASEWTDPAIGA
ncbi:TetR/AcrR family transcriptional regulator [Arthrobacter sp. UYEF3]|uniref:TetR/AcrR family transcriptional regulator n=1 Tax=Arthrobacter sp. UYEF3 TaxID=1756365 RepID=UPI003398CEF5